MSSGGSVILEALQQASDRTALVMIAYHGS
jgi:hypothetical protein